MKKLYSQNKLTFALAWIGIYCLSQSLANPVNAALGIDYAFQAVFNVLLSAYLLGFLKSGGLFPVFGLCKSTVPARKLLWYLPLLLIMSSNLWYGVTMNMSVAETLCYLVCMLCVGFLEELIFRGFLFKAMAQVNVTSAIMVSSITFGMGHLLNLVNGSGMALIPNLCQVCGATAIGFLFVTLFYRTGSLLPCIAAHSTINMLSAFAQEAEMTTGKDIASAAAIIVLSLSYTCYLIKTVPKE